MAYSSALKILTPLGSRTVYVVVPQMVAMRQSMSSPLSALSGSEARNHDKKLDAPIKAKMVIFKSSGKRGRNI